MITIAIDGFAGTGKSSTAKVVAHTLGFTYVDTGAMYRAITMFLLDQNIPFIDNSPQLIKALEEVNLAFKPIGNGSDELAIFLNGECAEPMIREPRVTKAVSEVAALTTVRHKLVEQQRFIGKEGGIVMDGRDIGTYVFPDAELKIFMTASVEVRAKRREQELLQKGIHYPYEEIKENLQKRDYIDSHREMAPLQQAEDAIVIDSTKMSFEDQVNAVVSKAMELISVDHRSN